MSPTVYELERRVLPTRTRLELDKLGHEPGALEVWVTWMSLDRRTEAMKLAQLVFETTEYHRVFDL